MTSKVPITPTKSRLVTAWRWTTSDDDAIGFDVDDIRTLRIWLGIFDAMTLAERNIPWILRAPSRASRVAAGAGTDIARVEECVNAWVQELGFLNPRWSDSQLCKNTHSELLVGTCPWCGSSMMLHSQ